MDLLRISQNIRHLRQAQGMTVEQLALKSGFSKGFVSQVENFRITPSLKALNKLSTALGVEISQIFSGEAAAPEYTFGRIDAGEPVTREDEAEYGIDYHALAYRQIGRMMEPFLIEYHPTDEERDFKMHDTEEFYTLLEGELDFYVINEQNVRRMTAGDTVYLRANLPHKVHLAEGCKYAKALSVYTRKGHSGE